MERPRVNISPLRLLLPTLLLLLGGCAALSPPTDPRPVEELVAQAEQRIRVNAYAEAADLYARAIGKDAGNSRYHLRRAEVLEALGRYRDARGVYRSGLARAGADDPLRAELIQRLALLSAEHLRDMDTAERLLEQMPAGSVARLDLAGYFYFLGNQHELALKNYNQALALAASADQKAIVLYHAALVYQTLGDDKNAVTSLFHAINHAEHLGLIRSISTLWERSGAGEPLPRKEK